MRATWHERCSGRPCTPQTSQSCHLFRDLQASAKLASACGCSDVSELASRHAAPLLTSMLQRCDTWTHSHPDLPAFAALLHALPGATLAELGTPLCLAVGSVTKGHEREAPLRVALLQMVDQLLENDDQGCRLASEHGLALFAAVLLPPLIWRAGAQLMPCVVPRWPAQWLRTQQTLLGYHREANSSSARPERASLTFPPPLQASLPPQSAMLPSRASIQRCKSAVSLRNSCSRCSRQKRSWCRCSCKAWTKTGTLTRDALAASPWPHSFA